MKVPSHVGLLAVAVFHATACMRTPEPPPKAQDNQPTTEYKMRGEIMGLDAKSQVAVVKHENIEGFMPAMTMEYPVKDKQEFDKLKVGDRIDSKLMVQGTDYWISKVQEVGKAEEVNTGGKNKNEAGKKEKAVSAK